ncbi:hypothetical protein COY33_00145 [candidate division WWE3 bacterium CG_4_10_14_0_2_um_filter_42_7]|uniref:Uncharacterized protein n=2 Tax=Katanobacteria TaxID=422282 RepID=A0A2H0X8T1_UNCKA|nr:MAG: hypothetical protein COT51_03705 [candidate division WWE3 bacterium CG08_land_8_20_14_0_20_41_15]PIZ44154.1 MAG: hypothetical protein COY33_00145 [candidate division WWE3 bacterium CG_4_10_14_0_2_um_filter_42_7]
MIGAIVVQVITEREVLQGDPSVVELDLTKYPEVNDSECVAKALRARRVPLPPGVLQRVCRNSFACSGDGPDG